MRLATDLTAAADMAAVILGAHVIGTQCVRGGCLAQARVGVGACTAPCAAKYTG